MSLRRSITSLVMLRRVLMMLGCLLFLSSMILPFLHEDRHYMIEEDLDRNTYWSFKSLTQQIRTLNFPEPVECWFYDYWVREYADRSELLPVFAFMFMIQILTLIAGTASVFINKRILALAPAMLCPMVTASMIYAYTSFRPWEVSYQQGYWLTYPSMLLFSIAFILSQIIHKKQTKQD